MYAQTQTLDSLTRDTAMARQASAKRSSLVEIDTALVREAVDDATRRERAKGARARLAMRRLVTARAELAEMTRARDAWRRACVVGFGLLAITWGTAGALALVGW